MKVSGQLYVPASLPPEKDAPVPIGYEAGWAPEPVWTLWRRENYFLRRDSNSEPVASRYTDCAILAPVGTGNKTELNQDNQCRGSLRIRSKNSSNLTARFGCGWKGLLCSEPSRGEGAERLVRGTCVVSRNKQTPLP
jgi:hypothetical protein